MELFGHRFQTCAYTVYIYILLYVYAPLRKVQKHKKHNAHKASLEDLEDLCPYLSPSVLAPPRKADALAMGEDASGLVLKGLGWGSLAWCSCSKTERVGWQSSSSCCALKKYFKVQIHGSYCWSRWKKSTAFMRNPHISCKASLWYVYRYTYFQLMFYTSCINQTKESRFWVSHDGVQQRM